MSHTPQELEQKFWKALESDRTVMLGLESAGGRLGLPRPMTALYEHAHGPIWFFTATDNGLVQALGGDSAAAVMTLASKDHALFATVTGQLHRRLDRAVIERLWNPFIAAWYEGGKDDPKLALLRFDPDQAEVWLNENSLLAGVKLLLGADPKRSYRDKTARLDLKH